MNGSHCMRLTGQSFVPQSQRVRQVWALAGLLLFLVLQVFGASGTLHQSLHAEANSPDHHCALTLLTHGQVNVPVAPVVWVAFAMALVFFLPLLQSAVLSAFDLRLASGRAPPRF